MNSHATVFAAHRTASTSRDSRMGLIFSFQQNQLQRRCVLQMHLTCLSRSLSHAHKTEAYSRAYTRTYMLSTCFALSALKILLLHIHSIWIHSRMSTKWEAFLRYLINLTFENFQIFRWDFLNSCSPVRMHTSERLISADIHTSVYNYKYTFAVELVPICKFDVVCIHPHTARRCVFD